MSDRNDREYCLGCESYMNKSRVRQLQEEVRKNSQRVEVKERSSLLSGAPSSALENLREAYNMPGRTNNRIRSTRLATSSR